MENFQQQLKKNSKVKGDLKSNGTRNPHVSNSGAPFNFDPRIYQALSSVSPTSGSNTVVTEPQRSSRSPSQPQRPNHLGSNFIPQTHFLTVDVVNHGATPGSDKESVLSSNSSSAHHSPYSTSAQTTSPSNATEKQKEKKEFTCTECQKNFSSASALSKHMLVHSDERKFVCHICQKAFKRQDHLNGHLTTHSDKKPFPCQIPDCGKSFSDVRSLKRHFETQHHNSPISGVTPSGYMPKLYPEYSEAMQAQMAQYSQKELNRLGVPMEPPRPSSVPLVPPEAKRVSRKRRSSSGEESSMQLDPTMIREIEARKIKESYNTHVDSRPPHLPHSYSPKSQGLLVTSSSSEYENIRKYEQQKMDQRYLAEYEKYKRESQRNEHLRELSETERLHSLHKDSEERKHAYSPASHTSSIAPPIINPHPHLWAQYGHSKTTTNTIPNPSMPYLMNSRKPINFPPHGLYPPHITNENKNSKENSKSDHYIRQQAMSTYLQMWANGQRGSITPEQLSIYQNQIHNSQGLSTPTDPAAIAIAAVKEHADRSHVYPFNRDSYYGVHPAMTQWQSTVMHEELSNDKDTKPYYPSNSNNNNDPAYMKTSPGSREPTPNIPFTKQERNIVDEPFKPSENNSKDRYMYNSSPNRPFYDRANRPPVIGHNALQELSSIYETTQRGGKGVLLEPSRTSEPPRSLDIPRSSPSRYDITSTPQRLGKVMDTPKVYFEPPEETSRALSPGRKRPRPGPIIIPPAVNNRLPPTSLSPSKSLQAIPKSIYTPPAMLSPKSVFFNPPAPTPRAAAPPTPGRFLLSIRRSTSVDQREASASTSVSSEEQLQVSTEVPEPKINVGVKFQATLPALSDRSEAQKDIHRASLMWAPIKEDDAKREEINAYLDMACSLALYGGSNNKEYALHILQRTRGNVKEAVRLLLSRRHILRADDPNADYHYSGSVRWTAKERLAFRQAYRTKGKLFAAIQKEVVTKSVQLCVEFYYLWKAMHPESFRARTRIVEVESEQDDEEVPPTPTAAVAPLSTLREPVFECDYPECRARFVSRQALNGHIRVHGGSLTKPPDTRRTNKQKHVVIMSSTFDETYGEMSPPKKKKTVSSVIVSSNPDAPQDQFQCKVCGRVFSKVKSRSAHMKTHVKRDDNNKPIKLSKKQKLAQQQQQQQRHTLPPPPHLPPGLPHLPPPQHHQHPQNQPLPPSSINPMTLYAHA